MKAFQEFFSNPLNILMSFAIMLFVIKEAGDLLKWYKGKADDYHKTESKKEDAEEEVNKLKRDLVEFQQVMYDIKKTLNALHRRLDENETCRKEDFVVSSRATLFQLYEDFKDKEDLTLSEYETFNNLADRYLADGGNGVFRHKIIPEIQEKKIMDN